VIPPVPNQIQVSRPMLEASIRQCEAEIGIWKAHLDAHLERGEHEVQHITHFCIGMGYHPAGPYLSSIAKDYQAKADLIRLSIAKMQGQLMGMKATLAEGDKKVAVPGVF
jgi:hypothetical protein